MSRSIVVKWVLLAASLLVGCASIESDLQRAQLLYKDARYEETEAWLSDLQREASSMPRADLARFYYLRGMTAFRLGQRDEALHYLGLADALVAERPEWLPREWSEVLARTLVEITPRTASAHARNPEQPDAM